MSSFSLSLLYSLFVNFCTMEINAVTQMKIWKFLLTASPSNRFEEGSSAGFSSQFENPITTKPKRRYEVELRLSSERNSSLNPRLFLALRDPRDLVRPGSVLRDDDCVPRSRESSISFSRRYDIPGETLRNPEGGRTGVNRSENPFSLDFLLHAAYSHTIPVYDKLRVERWIKRYYKSKN